MNTDSILKLAVNTLKSTFPSAIYQGTISVVESQYNPVTLMNEDVATTSNPIEIIMDTLTSEEIQASNLLSTDLKLYVIGDKVDNIDFYSFIFFNNEKYKIKKLINQLVGSKTALWTIACRK